MGYSDIFAKFLELFPNYMEQVKQWAPAGKGGIIVKLNNGVGLSFRYHNEVTWTLEASGGYPVRRA